MIAARGRAALVVDAIARPHRERSAVLGETGPGDDRRETRLADCPVPRRVIAESAFIVERSHAVGGKPFSSSHVNQMLVALVASGLVDKNRHGRYSFAVPLFGSFVLRQMSSAA